MKDIFFCLCGHGTSQHSVVWLSEPCDVCDCAQYRANRCLCHLKRQDGTSLTCYVEVHANDATTGVAAGDSVVRPARAETGGTTRNSTPANQPFWQQLADGRDAKILAEAGPNPGPGYVLRADNNGRYSYEAPHRAHKRLRGLSARYGVCSECGDALLAWMAARSGNAHIQQRAADWIRDNNVPGYEWLLARYYPEVTK